MEAVKERNRGQIEKNRGENLWNRTQFAMLIAYNRSCVLKIICDRCCERVYESFWSGRTTLCILMWFLHFIYFNGIKWCIEFADYLLLNVFAVIAEREKLSRKTMRTKKLIGLCQVYLIGRERARKERQTIIIGEPGFCFGNLIGFVKRFTAIEISIVRMENGCQLANKICFMSFTHVWLNGWATALDLEALPVWIFEYFRANFELYPIRNFSSGTCISCWMESQSDISLFTNPPHLLTIMG